MAMDLATVETCLEHLAKAGHISACLEILHHCPDAHLALANHMTVDSWGWGSGPNPNHSSRVPEEYRFEYPWWEAIWEYVPDDLSQRVNEFFEEEGCDDMR